MFEWRPLQGTSRSQCGIVVHLLESLPYLTSDFNFFWLRNAHAIALFLEQHDGVTKTVYPGLKSHPQHEIAKRQQHGFGAMITFYCVGGRAQSAIVLENVSHSSLHM